MINKHLFGYHPCGIPIYAYNMKESSELEATVLDYGGIVQSLSYPASDGRRVDLVGGFDTIDGYIASGEYQGAIIGRVANRISDGKFTIGGKQYSLYKNEPAATCHGGRYGFNMKLWDAVCSGSDDNPELRLNYISPNGEEGFPGELSITVIYKITISGGLRISYRATTDQLTIINLTNHSYFNLNGFDSGTIDDHIIRVNGSRINETDSDMVPTGYMLDVTSTPYDLRKKTRLGDVICSSDPKIREVGGLDTNYILDGYDGSVRLQAEIYSENTSIGMRVLTDNTSILIYTANKIAESESLMKHGISQIPHFGVCFEAASMPDAVNHRHFDDISLRPGEIYERTTEFEFYRLAEIYGRK